MEKDFIQLAGAYAMEISLEKPKEKKVRLEGQGTFIDIWFGRKGVTVGVYDTKKHILRYQHKVSIDRFEDILLGLNKHG